MPRPKMRAVLPPLLLAGLTLACGGSGGTTPPPTPPSAIAITLNSTSFSPAVDTVAASGTVTWNWASNQHDIVSTGSPAFTGTAAVYDMPYTYGPITFPVAGSYVFYCSQHGSPAGGMRGTIVVE
ncbi:MAG: hypothetical protein ABJD11_05740 [Gemmatimonadota bacterium]